MKTTDKQFTDKLNKLCDENWKAKRILEHAGSFNNLPDYQQTMFLKEMDLKEVDVVNKIQI
jgi:hypothetical protein